MFRKYWWVVVVVAVGLTVAIAALDPTPKQGTPTSTTLPVGAPARPCYAPDHYVPYRINKVQAQHGFGINGVPSDVGSWVWVSPDTKKKWDSGWLPKHAQLGPFNTASTSKPTCVLNKSSAG